MSQSKPVSGTCTISEPLSGEPSGDATICDCGMAGLPLRSAFGLTAIENVTLDVVRLICLSFATGEADHYSAAYDHAELYFGATDGPELVARATALVRAVRSERKGSFNFLSSHCRHICDDELAMLTVVKSARLKGRDSLNEIARFLSRAAVADQIVCAAEKLTHLQRRKTGTDNPAPDLGPGLPAPATSIH